MASLLAGERRSVCAPCRRQIGGDARQHGQAQAGIGLEGYDGHIRRSTSCCGWLEDVSANDGGVGTTRCRWDVLLSPRLSWHSTHASTTTPGTSGSLCGRWYARRQIPRTQALSAPRADLLPSCWRSTIACRSAVWGIGYLVSAAMIDSRTSTDPATDLTFKRIPPSVSACVSCSHTNVLYIPFTSKMPRPRSLRRTQAEGRPHSRELTASISTAISPIARVCKQANGGAPMIRLAAHTKSIGGGVDTRFLW